MGAKLVSGRVEKISSANVSADRYQFLSLSEAEPDLGLPLSDGQVLASNTSGGRYFVTLNTDNVTEANSLYYTNARVQSHLDAVGYQTAANILANVVTVMDLSGNTTTDLAEGNNLYYTNARVGSYLAQNDISVQSLVVQGNLTVQGTTTTLNTDILTIEDKNIVLANGAINSSVADGAGITIDGAQANIVYRESGNKFEINKNLEVTGNIIAGSGGGGSITGANLITANVITVNASITVAGNEVLTSGNTTTDLNEGTNLYYTNARVIAGLTNNNITLGNITASSVTTTNVIAKVGAATGNIVINVRNWESAGSNLYIWFDAATKPDVKAIADFGNIDGWTVSVSDGNSATVTATNPAGYFSISTSSALTGSGTLTFTSPDYTPSSLNIKSGDKVWRFEYSGNLLTPGNVYTNVIGTVSSIDNFTTSNLSEGINLYYTNARVQSHLDAGGYQTAANILANVVLVIDLSGNTTTDLNEGTNLYYTNSRVESYLQENGYQTAANILANVSAIPDLSTNTTTDLNEGNNLYYTNARVFSNVSNMSINVFADVYMENPEVNDILIWDGSQFILTGLDQATASNVANLVLSLQINNTDELSEGNVNLYYTNARARTAFTAGKGIVIQQNGVISSTDDSDLYNLDIDGAIYYDVTDTMAPAITFAGNNLKYIVRSIHVVNISSDNAFISSNVLYANGNTAYLSDMFVMPEGSALEYLKRTQIFTSNDKISFQSFDANGTPANGLISVTITYETLGTDEQFFGVGQTLSQGNSNVLVWHSIRSYSILESVKLVNLENEVVRTKVFWADGNDIVKSYYTHNLPLPPNSSVEILQGPKRLNELDKLYVSHTSNANISAFVSGRYGPVTTLGLYTANTLPGGNILVSFASSEDENTVLYYTIE